MYLYNFTAIYDYEFHISITVSVRVAKVMQYNNGKIYIVY